MHFILCIKNTILIRGPWPQQAAVRVHGTQRARRRRPVSACSGDLVFLTRKMRRASWKGGGDEEVARHIGFPALHTKFRRSSGTPHSVCTANASYLTRLYP